jgi:hypothetical protein
LLHPGVHCLGLLLLLLLLGCEQALLGLHPRRRPVLLSMSRPQLLPDELAPLYALEGRRPGDVRGRHLLLLLLGLLGLLLLLDLLLLLGLLLLYLLGLLGLLLLGLLEGSRSLSMLVRACLDWDWLRAGPGLS